MTESNDATLPDGRSKALALVLWILGALPLGIYPMVLVASVMSLAAVQNTSDGPLVTMVARGFQLTSLAYPLVYVAALLGAGIFKRAGKVGVSRSLAWVPLAYLLLVVALFYGWMIFGT